MFFQQTKIFQVEFSMGIVLILGLYCLTNKDLSSGLLSLPTLCDALERANISH
jgi:hypothetical protein